MTAANPPMCIEPRAEREKDLLNRSPNYQSALNAVDERPTMSPGPYEADGTRERQDEAGVVADGVPQADEIHDSPGTDAALAQSAPSTSVDDDDLDGNGPRGGAPPEADNQGG